PNNCVLAIFGDVKTADVKAAVERAFSNWTPGSAGFQPSSSGKSPELHRPNAGEPRRVVETRDKKQAVIVIGFRGTTMHDPDRHALDIVQAGCTDWGPRLFIRGTDELGLAHYGCREP